jgi:serine/threonine protein kinase
MGQVLYQRTNRTGYQAGVDLWSLGVIVYVMLSGDCVRDALICVRDALICGH